MPHAARERSRRTRRPSRDIEERARPQEEEHDEDRSSSQDQGGAISELRGVMSEAAVSVLAPVAKKLATQGAKMAVERGPELMEGLLPKLQDLGGKFGGLGGGGEDDEGGGASAGDGTGKGRRMPIQQAVDVAAPIDVVYDQWTQFEDYPKFMHRVQRVEQRDEARVVFYEKMWGVSRQWEAEIVEQVPDERIVWETVSGMAHTGVVTFHELSDRLTRIELNIDIEPEGPLEKIARGARFAKRAVRADLHRFKAFVEMRDEETGAWRGTIEEGEVVEEDDYEDEPADDEPEASEDPEDEEAYEDTEEDEEDEERSRQAASKSKGNGGRAKQSSSSSRKKPASSSSRSKSSGGSSRSRGSGSSGSRGGGSSRGRSAAKSGSGSRSRAKASSSKR
jgi:uncharacterized membrane protein